ncbi:unnamed protein product [Symbiodinium sp. CCMP2592]|nr:unnamed protein product [Symbiodinium sp. CCMP2592]
MARPRPPDPLGRPGECVELSHHSRLQLVEDDESDVAILINHISGERVVLEKKTDDGRLHFTPDQRYGFLLMGGKSVWARLLKWHGFQCRSSGETFLAHKLAGEAGVVVQWLDESIGRTWRKLDLPGQSGAAVVCLEFDQTYRKSGCSVYWSLQSLLKSFLSAESASKISQTSISTWFRKSWRSVLEKHLGRGCRVDDHILATDRQRATSSSAVGPADAAVVPGQDDDAAVEDAVGPVADDSVDGGRRQTDDEEDLLQVNITMLSTVAMLQLLLHMCNKPPMDVSEDAVRQFTRRLLACFHVGLDSKREEPIVHSQWLRLRFDEQFSPHMSRTTFGEPLFSVSKKLRYEIVESSHCWKMLPKAVKKSVALRSRDDIVSLLIGTFRRSNCAWITDQLAFGIAATVEAERYLVFQKSSTVMSESAANIKPRRSLNDAAVLAHRAREAFKDRKSDKKDLLRYFLGCRRAMADTRILAIADDESRVGGKERLMLCAMSEQGEIRDMKIRMAQPGEPVEQVDKDLWKERARRFLKREAGRQQELEDSAVVRKRLRPPARLPSFDLLLAKSNALACITGHGLEAFVPKDEDKSVPLWERHVLVESSDQGSLEDPLHSMWKSLLNGVKESNLYSVVSLSTVWLNLHEGKWWAEVTEAWTEFVATADKRDPLICATLSRMSRFSADHGVTLDDFMSDLAAGNSNFLHRRGESVQPSRWFTWQDSIMKRLDNPADLHLQYLVMLFHGISMGYLAVTISYNVVFFICNEKE